MQARKYAFRYGDVCHFPCLNLSYTFPYFTQLSSILIRALFTCPILAFLHSGIIQKRLVLPATR